MDFSHDLALALTQSTNEFPVDFDDAWQWIGYATKQKAKNKLLNNFEQGLDFNLTQMVKVQKEGRRTVSRPYEHIALTTDCFKSLGMMAGTEKGKEIRRYFLDCERQVKALISAQQQQAPQPLPNPRDRLEDLRLGMDLMDKLGGIDPKTELHFKDLIRDILLEDKLDRPALPGGRLEWPVSDRAKHLGYNPSPGELTRIGKVASRLYKQAHEGNSPPKRERFVGGTTRMVCCYGEADLSILDQAIEQVMNPPVYLVKDVNEQN